MMVRAGLIETEKLAVVEFDAESVTLMVKVAEPATGVAPETTPAPERLSPTAAKLVAPDVTVQVYPVPEPPAAVRVCVYALPTKPVGRVVPEVMVSEALTLTENVTVAVFDAESVTLAAKVALPTVGVAPDNKPALDKLRPIAVRLVPPVVTVQV